MHTRTKKVAHLALAPFSTIRFSTLESVRYMKIVAIGAKDNVVIKRANTIQVTSAVFFQISLVIHSGPKAIIDCPCLLETFGDKTVKNQTCLLTVNLLKCRKIYRVTVCLAKTNIDS